ncbi:TetR/AcrR family transcriptional regulator [Inconstantimicrobium mannanitabidum]|uniref:TetR family transcriptional regulator n=1 Tax=Inconstantimicrobium mannanitabidum TaxID=1604901 RepID=A0ACB5RDH6_9CLOT|nr:TetR/AcrR family transcriptional regulator [Clostridium sp. TW13]GKX67093.1 TetR family transcriptional regulator [Clostridium sp. TW13]
MKVDIDKREDKKKIKEDKLYKSAYELFTTKGVKNTAIDDIVKKAGIAKGTFYLYFKDKRDIINKLILLKSRNVLNEAIIKTKEANIDSFQNECLYFVEYIINYFKKNTLMLNLIDKNFSWSVCKFEVNKTDKYENIKAAIKKFIDNMMVKGMEREEAEITLFMVMELVGSVCYTSIINNEPTDIDTIKPVLYKKIIRMVNV